MAENKLYLALGEEASRGTKEATTLGLVPLQGPSIPKMEYDDRKREEFRGDDSVKGSTLIRRLSQKWSGTIEFPFFTEAGTTTGMIGTIFKHFFGHTTSAQNATTGQYLHMLYPVADPFATADLGGKALTLNLNINEGTVQKNWPFVGGRVMALNFAQEVGGPLVISADMFGQFRDTVTAEVGSVVWPAENLRGDYNNLTVYQGATRVGVAPDYTDFTFGGATVIKPDSISVKIENGMEDVLRLGGVDYPDKTRMGMYKVTLEMVLDWEDPASGFSTVDEFNAWMASIGETDFTLVWDTGTQAGTGDNHALYLDIPRAVRQFDSEPDYSLDKDPMVTLVYEGLYDETTALYIVGLLLKNSATAV